MKVTIHEPQTFTATAPIEPPPPRTPAPPPAPRSSPLMTERELSAHLRICRRQLYNWRVRGFIPYLKLGKAVRFRPTDVERALDAMTINPSH